MMKKYLSVWVAVWAVALLLMQLPPVQAANTIYMTALNDSLLALNDDTMPFWAGGSLYVPYTAFDGNNSAKVSFGISSSYNRSTGTLGLFTLQRMMVFELHQGISYNGLTDEPIFCQGIVRNGKPYVPVAYVCEFFGLNYSMISMERGQLIRIKDEDAALSDVRFMDAASTLIGTRLREYQQDIPAVPAPGVRPPTALPPTGTEPPLSPEEGEGNASKAQGPLYLAIQCEQTEGLEELLTILEQEALQAAVFLPPQGLEREDNLVERILVKGHQLGLLVSGEAMEKQLQQGVELLAQSYFIQTALVQTESHQREGLTEKGWIVWRGAYIPEEAPAQGLSRQLRESLSRASATSGPIYLTLPCSPEAQEVLPPLLEELRERGLLPQIPLETRL